ncbi:ABC transporter ATP-binding protein [Granulicatella sp. zg-ZJ]|uniref:ABC transporter ATP-binding protein n=1 Tax=Granulicatella sp. zg-ZJ TaxID=2678504 RepID=UPI001966EDD4|nr:ABC transporter ATP-binding protein [Granulicatella sp. zg-ZJ]MBS4750375.1 ABC transporter ATP-binding protein [Carnobacteriaceae bacterium zg-ZUI78]
MDKKQHQKALLRLLTYMKRYSLALVAIIIITILSVFMDVQLPKILGGATTLIFDSFSQNQQVDFNGLWQIAQTLIILYVLAAALNFLGKYILSIIQADIMYRLQKEVKEKLVRVSIRYYDENSKGDLLSRATNDMQTIDNALGQITTQILTSVFTLIGIVYMMFTIHWGIALLGILGIPLSSMVISYITKHSQILYVKQQNRLGALNGYIEEHYTGHEIVKSFSYEERSMDKFKAMNDKLYQASWKAQFLSGMMYPISRLINNIVYVFIAVIGGLSVSAGALSVGSIQALLQYTQQLSRPMGDVANMIGLMQAMSAACQRVFDLLDAPEMEMEEKPELPKVDGQVDFDHVSFGYSIDKPLMKDLNIHVKAGQTVAIVGPTGAGKTTVINLLMRFYDITGGKILIDGHDISNYSKQSLRDNVGMVLQDTWLFNGTIRENIRYAKQDATDEEVVSAAKQAFADDFIRKLPHGYDTIITEESDNISQGQKQLLTIARAILAGPSIFILDEATSNIDTRTEMQIQSAMDHIMANKTSFVIAHRLSTIRDADKILVMQQGNVIEQGTHDELLQANGFYAGLYRAQFEQ